ncbi:MAG: thioredoxin domain-containing protein [Gemmatimonadota bacterium]
MNGKTVLFLLGLVAAGLFGWGLATMSDGAPGAGGTTDASNGGDILARVAGEEITRAEVETNAGGQLTQLRQQMFDITEQALNQTIDGTLLDLEAENRGLDREALLEEVVETDLPLPTETQIDSVYEEARARINAPRDSVAPQIAAFLQNRTRRARYDSLISGLREDYEVVNYLEPPRFDVAATGPALGPETAPVTIVEFSDFECPFCLRIHPTLKQVMDEYDGRVRLVFRQFPLNNIHPHAQKAAEASLCADAQGKFWEMHDAMFENPRELAVEDLKTRATEIGLDRQEFEACLDSGKFSDEVLADLDAGRALGVTGTPALYINGRFLSGAQPYEVISRVIEDELRRGGAS